VKAPVVELFEVVPAQIEPGKPITVRWRVKNARSVSIHPFERNLPLEGMGQYSIGKDTAVTIEVLGAARSVAITRNIAVTRISKLPAPENEAIKVLEVVPGRKGAITRGATFRIKFNYNVVNPRMVVFSPYVEVFEAAGCVGKHETSGGGPSTKLTNAGVSELTATYSGQPGRSVSAGVGVFDSKGKWVVSSLNNRFCFPLQ
jgi:hypothetical protein